ncbi:MAG: outer membrane beta-barrel protein [Thiobacillaceae bacterium]
MKFSLPFLVLFVFLIAALAGARAEDTPYSWQGGYVGLDTGYAWDLHKSYFTFYPSSPQANVPPETTLHSSALTGGISAGYNYQIDNIVLGPVAEVSWLGRSIGTTSTGITQADRPFIDEKSQRLDWLGTYQFKLGVTPVDNMLVYGTAGLASGHPSETTHLIFPTIRYDGNSSGLDVGPALGAGVEYAFDSAVSVKAEYLHYSLEDVTVMGIPSSVKSYHTNDQFTMDGNILRVGLNYKLDALAADVAPEPSDMGWVGSVLRDLQYELGMRYWYSGGKTANHLYDTDGVYSISKLSYSDLVANSAELFGRVEPTDGGFVKGIIGLGAIDSGHLKDEDFEPFSYPYSATFSSQKNGILNYGTFDVGYDAVKEADYAVGPFVGYNYYHEKLNADGCSQLASGSFCVPTIANVIQGITNNDKWQSLRIGLNGEAEPIERIKLTADAAWLPYMDLSGLDSHWVRINSNGGFTGPIPTDGVGHNGYQLESVVSYQVTPALSLGLGARYWHMYATGKYYLDGRIVNGTGLGQIDHFSTDRYGVLAQLAYHF